MTKYILNDFRIKTSKRKKKPVYQYLIDSQFLFKKINTALKKPLNIHYLIDLFSYSFCIVIVFIVSNLKIGHLNQDNTRNAVLIIGCH